MHLILAKSLGKVQISKKKKPHRQANSTSGITEQGYCAEREDGALNWALSGTEAISCATLDMTGWSCS